MRGAVALVVLDSAKDFVKVFFGVPPVVQQFIIKPQDLGSPKAGGLGVVLCDMFVQLFSRFSLALLHRVEAGRHVGV